MKYCIILYYYTTIYIYIYNRVVHILLWICLTQYVLCIYGSAYSMSPIPATCISWLFDCKRCCTLRYSNVDLVIIVEEIYFKVTTKP